MGDASRPFEILLLAWSIVDLVQLPLVFAVVASFWLSRRLGRAWKGVAVGFGGYAAWVVVTARFVPYSPSGLVVLVFGMLQDPRRDTPAERVWLLGAGAAVVVFWAVPVALAWRLGRRPGPRATRAA